MTRSEFFSTITYLTAAIGKPIADGEGQAGEVARKARLDVYFDLLGELPADAFLTAAKRVASEHVWASFPTPAELIAAAAETMQGEVKRLSSGEAWKMAWKVACCYDPSRTGPVRAKNLAGEWQHFDNQLAKICEGMPAIVVEAINAFGASALADSDPNYARREFVQIFDGLAARELRRAILPASVQKSIAAIGKREAAVEQKAPVRQALASIGVEP